MAGDGAQHLEVALKVAGLPKPQRPTRADGGDGVDAGAPQAPRDSALRIYERVRRDLREQPVA